MSRSVYASDMSDGLADLERRAATRTVLVATSVRAALTLLLGVGFLAGCGSALFLSWPLGAQLAVFAVVAINVVLLRRFCGALHTSASATLQRLPATATD